MIAKKLLNNIQKRGVYTINQNDYVGQTPVSIVNNTISLETNFVNKVNSIDNLQRNIETNTNSINSINTTLNGIPEQLTTITNNVSTNTQNIQTNTTNIETNTTNIETNTNNITTNTQQIEAVKTKAETNETNITTINTTLPNKLDTATYNQEKTNFAKTNEANTFTETNTFNAATTFGGETTFTGVANLNGGFTVPDTVVANAVKDITNSNDNQLVNYKAFYWKEINSQNSISINANTVSAYEFTTNQLVARKDIRIMLRFAATSYDYTLIFELVCNSLSYKNQGEVKILHWGNNTVSTLDPTKFVFVTVAQYSNNKLRINIKNATDATIQTGSIKTYIQALKPNFQR